VGDAGVILTDERPAEPSGADEATAASAVVGDDGELPTAKPSGLAERPADTAQTNSDGDGEPGNPPHHI
jgi:hypothetical protein